MAGEQAPLAEKGAAEYEWAVRFPSSDINHIQRSEADARALVAKYPDHDVTLLRRPAHVYTPNWEEVPTRV